MPEAPSIRIFRKRLLALGCPADLARRRARELADHREDLKQAALQEGLSEADAEARADQRLGEPVALAEQTVRVLRQSSWWGRHPLIAFGLLPMPAIFSASLLGLAVAFGLVRVCVSADGWAALADGGPGFRILPGASRAAYCLSIALTSGFFCWLARQSAVGWTWGLLACGCCSLQSFFGYCQVLPHFASVGYSSTPNWSCAVIPLWVAGAAWLWHLLTRNQSDHDLGDTVTRTGRQCSTAQ